MIPTSKNANPHLSWVDTNGLPIGHCIDTNFESIGVYLDHTSMGVGFLENVKKKYNMTFISEDELSIKAKPNLEVIETAIRKTHRYNQDALHLIKSGTCQFLVYKKKDVWLRISCQPGDIVLLKKQTAHRFILPENPRLIMIGMYKVPEESIVMEDGIKAAAEANSEIQLK